MKFSFVNATPDSILPPGFFYVSQDNYYIANLNEPQGTPAINYLYSDSATSCIIVVVEGKDKDNNPLFALTHLSRKERFLRFFEVVSETFCGAVSVFAQGANPPFEAASQENTQTLLDWITSNKTTTASWYINQVTLSLGQGDPQVAHRGCYGINLETIMVSNQRYDLTEEQRDPTGGEQTLFCVFGLKVTPQLVLPVAGESFTEEQLDALVAQANEENWTDILYMTKDEVLAKYSSTPEYEVPWFYASLRASALYVKNYLPKSLLITSTKGVEELCVR